MEAPKPPMIGQNIKRIRKEQQMTLDVLAEKSGVSKAMLSQIEAQKVNPTVATIWKIARGLDVDLEGLLKGEETPARKFTVTERSEATVLDTAEEGLHLQVLSPIEMAEDLEIYMLTFDPGGVLNSSPHAPGTEEYLTVLDGGIRVEAGDKTAKLGPGDFILYNCDINHSIENVAETTSRVHMVVRFTKKHWA